MKSIQSKREKEKRIVSDMIALYCRKNHGSGKGELCEQCAELAAYAKQRSDKCPFMEKKTFCSNCSVHCYEPQMRERIRAVMRFSGPRMIIYHPVTAVSHAVSVQMEKRKQKNKQPV